MRVIIKLDDISDKGLAIVRAIQRLGHDTEIVTNCQDLEKARDLRRGLVQSIPATRVYRWSWPEALPEPQKAILLQEFLLRLRPDLIVVIVSDENPDTTSATELGNRSMLNRLLIIMCAVDGTERSATDKLDLPADLARALSESPKKPQQRPFQNRLKLAMVGPVLPSRSGIAVYTDELVNELSAFYDITLVDTTPEALRRELSDGLSEALRDDSLAKGGHPNLAWFMDHAAEFDRVVYQVGNSAHHAGMLAAIGNVPGISVLHDFFLGHLRWWEYAHGVHPRRKRELWREHGLKALLEDKNDDAATALIYPFNASVFEESLGVIVHSKHASDLTRAWHGATYDQKVFLVPLLRKAVVSASRQDARQALGLSQDAFVVCSFGGVSPLKLHHTIINAWADSSLALNPSCKLIFVGDKGDPKYLQQLQSVTEQLPFPENVEITGFTDSETYSRYLDAADLAIQLRTQSRGETSAAVLDCMNRGLPTIVNSHGSMAELDDDAVFKVRDDFTSPELVHALETLHRNLPLRLKLSAHGREVIASRHCPKVCASRYHEIIEAAYTHTSVSKNAPALGAQDEEDVLDAKDALKRLGCTPEESIELLDKLLDIQPIAARTLFLDITDVVSSGRRSGIERTATQLCASLIRAAPNDLSVVPVYLSQTPTGWCHFIANRFVATELGKTKPWLADVIAQPLDGDVLMTLDLTAHPVAQAKRSGLFDDYQKRGVKLASLVYDLLPIRMPEVFPPRAGEFHAQWLEVVASFDAAICISNHVAQDLQQWMKEQHLENPNYKIGAVLLGSETGIFSGWGRTNSELFGRAALTLLEHDMTYLMVGTIEPRKGYLQTLEAFSHLWRHGFDGNLIIVGHEGWKSVPDDQRHDIPETVAYILQHPELGKRLHWLSDTNDPELDNIYQLADCLIAASYDEGFGLPLIEAARHRLPVLARDIEVFREVAPLNTRFFKANNPVELAEAIQSTVWEPMPRPIKAPPTTTWAQSAEQVLQWLRDKGLLQS